MGDPTRSLSQAMLTRPAVAYLRASTKKQHLSCDDQLHAIEEYCRREGLRLIGVFRDDGVSGTKGRGARGGWDELLDYVAGGHLAGGVVVVWSLDRWARDFRAGLLAAWEVGDHQVEIHTTDTGRVDLDSVEGQLVGTLKLALAAQESRERSRRVRERKAIHLAAGYWVSFPPFGFLAVGPRGRKVLEPDPVEAPIVLWMFEAFDRGMSMGLIAADLNSRGIRTRRGNSWCLASIEAVLAGWSYGGFHRERKSGKVRQIRITTFMPRDLWERCRQRAESKGGVRGSSRKYALSGLVICGQCGSRMHVHSWPNRDGSTRRGYRCPRKILRACTNPTIGHLCAIESGAMRWWRQIVTDRNVEDLAREQIAAEHAEALAAAAARRPLYDELADLERHEMNLVEALKEYGPTPAISSEVERIRERRSDIEAKIAGAGAAILPIDLEAAVSDLMEEFQAIDSPRLLREWIDEITIYPSRKVVIRGFGGVGSFRI